MRCSVRPVLVTRSVRVFSGPPPFTARLDNATPSSLLLLPGRLILGTLLGARDAGALVEKVTTLLQSSSTAPEWADAVDAAAGEALVRAADAEEAIRSALPAQLAAFAPPPLAAAIPLPAPTTTRAVNPLVSLSPDAPRITPQASFSGGAAPNRVGAEAEALLQAVRSLRKAARAAVGAGPGSMRWLAANSARKKLAATVARARESLTALGLSAEDAAAWADAVADCEAFAAAALKDEEERASTAADSSAWLAAGGMLSRESI